jgi:nicotinamidase-related amidase
MNMPGSGTALVLVDIQNDFLPPGGSLAVTDGDKIIPVVLELLKDPDRYDIVVATLVGLPTLRYPGFLHNTCHLGL